MNPQELDTFRNLAIWALEHPGTEVRYLHTVDTDVPEVVGVLMELIGDEFISGFLLTPNGTSSITLTNGTRIIFIDASALIPRPQPKPRWYLN